MSDASRNRVLIVDDDPVASRVFQRSLELEGYDVVVASGRAEGLWILRTDPTIGVVLLDLTLHRMDGWGFLHAQRADFLLAAIPTIILSGSVLAQAAREAKQAPDHVLKSVVRDHLISLVAAHCRPQQGPPTGAARA
jgi:CheY-like chemotaxis protein